MKNEIEKLTGYTELLKGISGIYSNAQEQAARYVNSLMVSTYWEIGRHIVEFEQGGSNKATYGATLLVNLSK